MQTFCTIITANYLPFAKVLFNSLKKFSPNCLLQVLIVDENTNSSSTNFVIHQPSELIKTKLFREIEKKYAHTNPDYFRWSLKPIFITYLLEKEFDKVIFLDPDIYFVGDHKFLFDYLNNASVILTPHWNNVEAYNLDESLIYLMRNGLFNAGFVGANRKGIPAIKWWAEACHYKIDRQAELGIFVDQKYLDILPVEYPNTQILQHRGLNIACWNMDSNKRTIVNGQLLINKKYEVVFIHFTKDTIKHILNGNDYQLRPLLDQYSLMFLQEGYNLQDYVSPETIDEKFSLAQKIKRQLLFRTRFKRWLLKLSQKI